MANLLLSEYRALLNSKIAGSATSGFYKTTDKDSWLNTAGKRVCNYRAWKNLEKAKKTLSVGGQEYYDYPPEFQADSIYDLEIDGVHYAKKDWDVFRDYVRAETEEKIFSSHDGEYFIYPVPEASDLEICVWGILQWVKLTAEGDESILPEKFDEAIVDLAFAECLDKKKDYSGAVTIRRQVEDPANPQVLGSGGILARLSAREKEGTKSGSVGRARSTRFM